MTSHQKANSLRYVLTSRRLATFLPFELVQHMGDNLGQKDTVHQRQGHGDDAEGRQGQCHDAHGDAPQPEGHATAAPFDAGHFEL